MRRFTFASVILAFLATLACGIISTPAAGGTRYRFEVPLAEPLPLPE